MKSVKEIKRNIGQYINHSKMIYEVFPLRVFLRYVFIGFYVRLRCIIFDHKYLIPSSDGNSAYCLDCFYRFKRKIILEKIERGEM